MSSRLVRYPQKNREVQQCRDPQHQIKNQCTEKFSKHDLPIAHRRSHERLDRAKLKFLGEQAHRDEWEDQNKGEPEKDGIKKRFLHRVLHLTLVHEGDLKIKVHSGDQQEKDKDYVGDRRVEVSISLVPLISNQVRMGELHKHILQRRSTLS